MKRKILALAIVLIISGLAPATAVVGFCAKMPCCFGEQGEAPVLGPNTADCCTTISCYEAPPHELTVSAKANMTAATLPALLPVVASMPNPQLTRRTSDDTLPPPARQQRLASLSILLI
ncbi:MAG TPA: hypothetical protein VNM92_01505 [Thermoanaerobaculia bacterium]|nr:hypothetical protein [Thermoanaerobaculia bacterium]